MSRLDRTLARALFVFVCLPVVFEGSAAFGEAALHRDDLGFRSLNDGSYAAANHGAGLRVRMTGEGMQAEPLDETRASFGDEAAWRMSMRLTGVGRDRAPGSVGDV